MVLSSIFRLRIKGPASFDTPLYKGEVSVQTGLFINGEFVDSANGDTIEVIHPCDGSFITSVSLGSSKDIETAVAAARHASKTTWGVKCPSYERGRLLNKFADLMEQHVDELCALEALDTGKNFLLVKQFDIPTVVGSIRYYAGFADKHTGKTVETNEGSFAYTRHEPIGVVGVITPWNFPLVLDCWKIGPILATGNCIVLKPSELTPLAALKLAELAKEAGFPPGVFNVVTGYGATAGQALVEHLHVGKVAFTGSTLVGRKVMETAARSNLKRVTLELGGKSPVIIFDDADLEQAIKWATLGAFHHSGQVCLAGTRIYVQEGIYDAFIKHFTAASQTLKRCDDPFASPAEGTQSPLITQNQYDRVMSYINSGKQEGANVHVGGTRSGDLGHYIEPTIFTDVRSDMKIVREEIFGPVIVVVKFKDEAEAINLANDTSFGLSSVVLTQNINRALTVAHALEAGSVFVNSCSNPVPQISFGGVKNSGQGKDLGEQALDEYTILKSVHVNIGVRL